MYIGKLAGRASIENVGHFLRIGPKRKSIGMQFALQSHIAYRLNAFFLCTAICISVSLKNVELENVNELNYVNGSNQPKMLEKNASAELNVHGGHPP